MELSGKTALITGAAGDLGSEMAFQLAQAGASIVMWDLLPQEQASAKIQYARSAGADVHYQQVDVSIRAQVDAAFEGLGGVDIVCSNAGIVEATPFLEVSQENWQRHMDVNLTGCFNVCQAAARRMVAGKTPGRIILTSSWVGSIPWPEIAPYTVSKAGVNMLVKAMARELAAYGIRVNGIAPGIVKAGLAGRQLREEPQYAARVAKVIPLGDPGTPVEVAQAVVYLAGPRAAYMTGSILLLDGGCSLFQFDS